MSLNVQSRPSKYQELTQTICEMTDNDVQVKILALQEVWSVPYPELINIPKLNLYLSRDHRVIGEGRWASIYMMT